MRIEGSVIVVTGGGSGIGAGLARRFVADGARAVVLADRNRAAAAAVAAELGERASAVRLDVTDEAAVAALVARRAGRARPDRPVLLQRRSGHRRRPGRRR